MELAPPVPDDLGYGIGDFLQPGFVGSTAVVMERVWERDQSEISVPGELGRLESRGQPLLVLYDPKAPDVSALHAMPGGGSAWFANLAIIAFASALLYSGVVYPRMKRGEFRRSGRILPLFARPVRP